jgi:hypothetical protein
MAGRCGRSGFWSIAIGFRKFQISKRVGGLEGRAAFCCPFINAD